MQNFKEFLEEKRNSDKGTTEELDDGIVTRASSIFGITLITNQYKKVKAERDVRKKIDRLADLILTATAQIYYTLKEVKKQ